jgi:hypothetical protein
MNIGHNLEKCLSDNSTDLFTMTIKKYLGLLLIVPLLTVSVASTFTTIYPVNALTKRDYTAPNDQPNTVTYGGNFVVCGNHICGPGEYTQMQQELSKAQVGKTTSLTMSGHTMMSNKGNAMSQTMPMGSKDLGSVLKLSNANLPLVIPLVKGLYDGKDVFYITTEASDSKMAAALTKFTNFSVTFAPALEKTSDKSLAQIFVFKNGVQGSGVLGFQPNVVDSIPTEAKYSPLWKINFVEWRDPTTATVLGSYDDIATAVTSGKVMVTPTNVVVNCPIIQWSGNKEGTVPAGHMQIRSDTTLTDATPYGGGQVLNINTQKMQVIFVAHRGFGPDGSTIYYIVTDTVMPDQANMMGVILANKTQATFATSSSSDLFQFGNGIKGTGPMGFQAGIGSTKPGDQFYSPMWRISMISWNDPSKAAVLENSHDITSHSDQIKITSMNMIVNCPFFSADTVFSHIK